MRIFVVDQVSLFLQKSQPPKLAIQVTGRAATSGWTEVRLERIDPQGQLSADGILDLEFIGTPPHGFVLQVITPVAADIVIEADVERIIGVQVHSRTNTVTELLESSSDTDLVSRPLTTLAVGEEDNRWLDRFTTLALGEEGGTSLRWGEDPPWKPWVGEKPPGLEDQDILERLIRRNPFGTRR